MASEGWRRAGAEPDQQTGVSLRPSEVDPRVDALLDFIVRLGAENDPGRLMAAVVNRLEALIPDAAVAIFQLTPAAGLPALSAAGHRWRSAERDAPGWLAGETSAVALLVRSLDEVYGRLAVASPGVRGAALGAEVLQAPVLVHGQNWGTLTLVRPSATPLSAFQRWLVAQMTVQFAIAWSHLAERLDLKAIAERMSATQDRLLAHERMQACGHLASSVAHDVNNLLTTIVGTIECVLQDDGLDEAVRGDLDMIRTAADQAVTVMAALRSFGARGQAREREVVPLEEIAQLALEPLVSNGGAAVDVTVQRDACPVVEVSAEDIRHLLYRLLENAVEATPNGGRIVVTVGESEGEAWVSVLDSGPGIPEADHERVFEPFYTTKDRRRHRGLGLSECWRIASAHGGAVRVSTPPDGGSLLTLRLPSAPSAEVQRLEIGAVHQAPPSLRVLLVDDQADVRESVSAMLSTLGHHVQAAAGGEQALALARESSFDVVITDLGMPGLNGLDVARGIRTIAPQTAIVLLTGWGLASGDRMPNDVSVVASKPLTLDSLSEILARALQPRAPAGA